MPEQPKKRKLWDVNPSIFELGRKASFFERRIFPPLRQTAKFGLYALAIAYPIYLVYIGIAFGGLVFWSFFVGSIALIGIAITKLGYAPNFRHWDVSLKRIKSFADRLASQGYVALAPDLYNGTVARTVKEAKEMMGRASDDSSKSIVLGAVDYLRSLPTVGARRIGAIGFSMGGGWALWLSVQKREDVAAVVVFYSTGGDDYSKARAAFLGHFAADDEWEPNEGVRAFESQLRASGRETEFHFYPGTKHWFVEENRPVEYNRAASDLAWKRTLEFLNSKLR